MPALCSMVLSIAGGVAGLAALCAGAAAALMSWGYLLWLKTRRPAVDRCGTGRSPEPDVDVIVAAYNEADLIEEKVANLQDLRYPAERLRFWIVDGASTDRTAQIAARSVRGDGRFTILGGSPDKTAQLNAALARGASPWILVTDADARLHPATLARLVAAALADESIGAVGATVHPVKGCHWLEGVHWRISNRVRLLESLAGCASMVTAPGYLVRRDILRRLPEDVVADDIHVAMATALHGSRVCFVDTPIIELRAPLSLPELYRHKLRKTLAYLRETYRFLPVLRRMPRTARAVFAWRAVQLILLPWMAALAAGAVLLAAAAAPAAAATAVAIGLVAALLVGTCVEGREAVSAFGALALALLLVPVCMTAFVIYPFTPRSACFPKVGFARSGEAGS